MLLIMSFSFVKYEFRLFNYSYETTYKKSTTSSLVLKRVLTLIWALILSRNCRPEWAEITTICTLARNVFSSPGATIHKYFLEVFFISSGRKIVDHYLYDCSSLILNAYHWKINAKLRIMIDFWTGLVSILTTSFLT